MDNLVYLSYGRGPYSDELIYSVLSALHLMGRERSTYRIIVYTDDAAAFADLPVHIESINGELLAEWAGPSDYIHRRKIFTIRDALQKFGGRLAYCDTDTYFFKHPRKLFARIRPGHTVMHIQEYQLYDRPARELAALLKGHDMRNRAGYRWNITPATAMFNSGVIGLHESDIPLLDEIVDLNDQIYAGTRYETTEQFAFGVCFHYFTTLHQSYDIIHHYWMPADRALFRGHLSRVLHDSSILSYEERFRRLLPYSPPSPYPRNLKEWMHVTLWKVAKRARMLDPLKRIAARAGLKDQVKRVAKWAGMSN